MKLDKFKKGQRIKLHSWEYQLSLYIARVLVIFVAIIAYMGRLIIKTLYRFKVQIYKLALIAIAVNIVMMFQPIANAPKSTHAVNGFSPVSKPVTEHEQIINYVYERFGKDADEALLIFSCESGLRPSARGVNTNGTVDAGIAQINSIHGVNERFLKNWRINIDIAYQLFKEHGNWSPWVCAHKLGL